MEGGEKRKIPLDSGLDIKSSDQLVPVDRPLFQHNRQRFQGHTLPTSLRYEHNGWAAGWNVYEFEVADASVETSPVGFTIARSQLNNNPTYIFRVRTGTVNVATIYWNGIDEVRTGSFTITHDVTDYNVVHLIGENNGHEYDIAIDMITGEFSYDSSEWLVVESSYHDATSTSGLTELQLIDYLSWVQFNCAVLLPEDLSYEGTAIAAYYSCVTDADETVHTWKSDEWGWEVVYNSTTNEVTCNGNTALAVLDNSNGQVSIHYDEEYSDNITMSCTTTEMLLQVYDLDVSQNLQYISSSAGSLTSISGTSSAVETWAFRNRGNSYLYPTSVDASRMFLCAEVPVWLGARLNILSSFSSVPLEYTNVNIIVGENEVETTSAQSGVYIARLYYFSNDIITFYEEEIGGGDVSFWIQDTECAEEHSTITNTVSTQKDVSGTFRYSVCVFNILNILTDEETGEALSSFPFTVDGYDSTELTEDAPWFTGGNLRNKVISQEPSFSDFEAGFYIEAGEVGVKFNELAGGGWLQVIDSWEYAPNNWPYDWYHENESIPAGVYLTWWDYNKLLQYTAEELRINPDYVTLFVSVEDLEQLIDTGDYVRKDEHDERVAEVLEAEHPSWEYFTVAEWNAAAEEWNTRYEEEINNQFVYRTFEGELPEGETGYVWDDELGAYRENIVETGIYVYDEAGGYRVAEEEESATHGFDDDGDIVEVSEDAFLIWNEAGGFRLSDGEEGALYLWDAEEGNFREVIVEEATHIKVESEYFGKVIEYLEDGKYVIVQITEEDTTHTRTSDGWYILGDKASYPDSYTAEEVIGAKGDQNYFVRVEEPLAYYNQEVTGSVWGATLYEATSNAADEAGTKGIDLVVQLTNTVYTDATSNRDYKLGDTRNYLKPYFFDVEDISQDTRTFSGLEDYESANARGEVALTFTSGPLTGLELSLVKEAFYTTAYLYSGVSIYNLGSSTYRSLMSSAFSNAGINVIGWGGAWYYLHVSVSISTISTGYLTVSALQALISTNSSTQTVAVRNALSNLESSVRSTYGLSETDTVLMSMYAYRHNSGCSYVRITTYYKKDAGSTVSAKVSFNGSTIKSYSSDTEGSVLTNFVERLGITPIHMDVKTSGLGKISNNDSNSSNLWLSCCMLGKIQSTLTLADTDEHVFSSSNFNELLTIKTSENTELQESSGFYIDRNLDSTITEEGICTRFGMEYLGVSLYSGAISGEVVSIYGYISPLLNSSGQYREYYQFLISGESEDEDTALVLIPGHIYYGSTSYIYSGYNLSSTTAGKSYSASGLGFSISGTTKQFYRVISGSLSWSEATGFHNFYNSSLPVAQSSILMGSITLGSVGHSGNGSSSVELGVRFTLYGEEVVLLITYQLLVGVAIVTCRWYSGSQSIPIEGHTFNLSLSSYNITGSESSIIIAVKTVVEYALTGRVPYQYNYSSSLSYDEATGKFLVDGVERDAVPVGTIATGYDTQNLIYTFISSDGQSYKYSVSDDVFTYGVDTYVANIAKDAMFFEVVSYEALDLAFILQGAYRSNNCEIVDFSGTTLTFLYEGQAYTFNVSGLLVASAASTLSYLCTDITDDGSTPSSETFALQNTSSEYQFLKQAWSTDVSVENFWWVDADTILELRKSALVVKKKVSSDGDEDEDVVDIDDWGGDMWEEAYSFPRTDMLDNTTIKYGMTCAYGGAIPRFWTVQIGSSSSITLNFYTLDSTNSGYSLSKVSVSVPISTKSLGAVLNESSDRLNSYSTITAETVIASSSYSGTVVGEHILFGIHLDNNFNQWALDISTSGELLQVVQGYGYIGVDGSATGGEIPTSYFDSSLGFNGAVYKVEDALQQEDITYTTSTSAFTKLDYEGLVVGDESQQWYLTTSLSGIVSHLLWADTSWSAVSLPITNNYTCVYGSASFGKRVISCYDMFKASLSELFDVNNFSSSEVRNNIDWADYTLYGYCPKVSTLLYLQQTMGQYAYVHYNSATPGKQKDVARENTSKDVSGFGKEGYKGAEYTAIGVQKEQEPEPLDPVTPENTDDFSFNLHGIRQTLSVTNPWSFSGGSKVCVLLLSGLVSFGNVVAQALNPVNVLQNQMSVGDIGRNLSQAFLKNIDMMASAQASGTGAIPVQQSAVASSCTLDMFYSTSEGQKISAGPGWVNHNFVAQCVAQSVTSNQMEMNQIGLTWLMEGLTTIATRWYLYAAELTYKTILDVNNIAKNTTVFGTNATAAICAGVVSLAGIAYTVAVSLLQPAMEAIDTLLGSLMQGGQVNIQNTLSKHVYSMEGKHKYGQKSECFMWPCFDVVNRLSYFNEQVVAKAEDYQWKLDVPLTTCYGGTSVATLGTVSLDSSSTVTVSQGDNFSSNWTGDVSYLIANCRGTGNYQTLPANMAMVIGTESFLPPVPFRNENIGVSEPVFATPPFQDYIISEDWELSRTASVSMTTWVSCKDTKLIDGEPSNIVVSDDFCGVACPYTAIEVKRGCEQKYIRPWAITPNALALNNTGFNVCYEGKAYHAFDGYGGRIVKWVGAPGMNKEGRVWQYAFIVNDRFKRSNKMPPNEFIGNFKGEPLIALKTTGEDKVFNHVTQPGRQRGLEAGTVGEDKDVRRYAVPVFSEFVNTLPAAVKTISAFNLSVVDGITSLTSENRDLQTAYKAPVSIDFTIGKEKYRFTNEYICHLDQRSGVTVVEERVPTLGLEFIGSTPYEAYLYSQATRQYYVYQGGTTLEVADMLERFRDVVHGRYDFVNQEVVMPCLATFVRLDKHVFDDEDETDNHIVPRLKGGTFIGEVAPPIETIYNTRSGFRTISLPSGVCYQGPNRCIINRFVYSDYMKEQIKNNYGKWARVPREKYHPFRDYGMEYERVDESLNSQVIGWTHNPFLLVTSPLGVSSEVDCMYEWEITFAWPVEMDELYDAKQYAVVNIWAECFTPGGKVIPDRPTHVYLYKELFTRTGNYGYYSFRYQSRCGAGNRERLHIWSDQYIAVSGLQVEYKPVTEKRTEILTQQVDVQDMQEI